MNERNLLLKQAGFSQAFVDAIQEFEKLVPDIAFDTTFDTVEDRIEVVDTSTPGIIRAANNNYGNAVVLVRD